MAETQRRRVPLLASDELSTTLAFLDFQREAVLIKCDGLSEDQLRHVAVSSGTNLLGLIRHLEVSERWWFHHHVAGADWPDDWTFSMDVAKEFRPADVIADYRDAWAHSNDVIRRIGDPGALTSLPVDDRPLPLRWVMAHMITEVARHAGHADILREQLDGTTGR